MASTASTPSPEVESSTSAARKQKQPRPGPASSSSHAPSLYINRDTYNSIEYPGYISPAPPTRFPGPSPTSDAFPKEPPPRTRTVNVPPTEHEGYIKALYTLGVKPNQLESLKLPSFGAMDPALLGAGLGGAGGVEGATGDDDDPDTMLHPPPLTRGSQTVTPIDAVFNTALSTLELNYRPHERQGFWARDLDPDAPLGEDGLPQYQEYKEYEGGGVRWSRPLAGERVAVGRVLVKLTMRRRRRKRPAGAAGPSGDGEDVDMDAPHAAPSVSSEGKQKGNPCGVFKADIVGIIKNTVRFRAMPDFQYTPFRQNDQTSMLVESLAAADPQKILDFQFSPLDEEYYVPANPLRASSLTLADASAAESNANAGPSSSASTLATPTLAHPPAIRRTSSSGGGGGSGRPKQLVGTEQDPEGLSAVQEDAVEGMGRYRSVMWGASPGVFSRQVVPHNFGFMPNPNSFEVEVPHRVTGEMHTRLVNKHRAKGSALASIIFDTGTVPTGPTNEIKKYMKEMDQKLLKAIQEHMKQKPVWQRQALINQFDDRAQKSFSINKTYFPACCYTFADGPWKNSLIKFGYDPRKDKQSYKYQRIYFRLEREHKGLRPRLLKETDPDYEGDKRAAPEMSWLQKKLIDEGGDPSKGHIFDGQRLHRDVAWYSLCDITDPTLHNYIHDPRARRDTIDKETGWYKAKQLAAIRAITRRKWVALTHNTVLDLEDFSDLTEDFYDFENVREAVAKDIGSSRTLRMGEGGVIDADTEVGMVRKKRVGRPPGGGGYSAPMFLEGIDQRRKDEKWKRKRVANNLPLVEEDQEALRLAAQIEQQKKEARLAVQRNNPDRMHG